MRKINKRNYLISTILKKKSVFSKHFQVKNFRKSITLLKNV